MSLSPRSIIEAGYDRTQTRAGWILVVAYLGVYILNSMAIESMATFNKAGGETLAKQGVPSSLGVLPSLSLSYLVFSISVIMLVWVIIVAIRVFANDHRDSIPPSLYTADMKHDMLWTGLGFGLVLIGVSIGTAAFVVPGIYLLIALFYFPVYLIERDFSLIDSCKKSAALVEGHKWQVLRISVMFVVIGTLVVMGSYIIGKSLQFIWPVAQELLSGVAISFVGVWIWATVIETFERLEAVNKNEDD